MLRAISLVAVVALTHSAFCDFAIADPDISFVRVAFKTESSTVTVSSGTRVDVVAAVLRGLNNCKFPTDVATVGRWPQVPKAIEKDADRQPYLTVIVTSPTEGGASTAYIAITPEFPFAIVSTITTELRACGFTDFRLLSDDEVTDLMDSTVSPVPDAGGGVGHKGDSRK